MQADYTREQLIALLPQQPPFLFLDAAEIEGEVACARYRITGNEAPGHFADRPVFPASLMMEALGQLACAWLLTRLHGEGGPSAGLRLFFVGADRIKVRRICTPGDLLELNVEAERVREPLAYFRGRIMVGPEKTAVCEGLALSFLRDGAAGG